jgi:aryl-alcohol dehydrogenase-like predicted oxidoreductase
LKHSENLGLPRIVSIQNPYNLINRLFEVRLAEFSHREQIGLLAYGPTASGLLSGKYLNGARPSGARMTLFDRWSHHNRPEVQSAVSDYVALAKHHGLSPVHLAQAFVISRPFVASALIGATSLEQLKENLQSVDVTLTPEVLPGIAAIHARAPNP